MNNQKSLHQVVLSLTSIGRPLATAELNGGKSKIYFSTTDIKKIQSGLKFRNIQVAEPLTVVMTPEYKSFINVANLVSVSDTAVTAQA